jgi:carboxyl-terminal processing protease
MTTRTFFLVVSPLVLLAAALGFIAAEARARPRPPSIFWSDDVVSRMRSLVEDNYVDEVSEPRAKQLFYSACKAYLGGLDDYCEFYTPDERKEMEQETQGEFGGVGIIQTHEKAGIRVRGARREDPAWKAGIRAGDMLVSVDGIVASGDDGAAALPRLRGDPGTPVRVVWQPGGGGERREATITRSLIKIDSVVGVSLLDPEAGIGYLRISRFSENTPADLKSALKKLKAQGARSFIVDLRSDYGGVLPASVGCADCFLDGTEGHAEGRGVVVVTKSRTGIDRLEHLAHADPDDVLTAPLVLLVDGNTASASEVLAGALQDYRRAILVGERTYGKFLVQRIVPLPELDVAVRLTTARYFTPFGRNLQRDDSHGVRGGLVPEVPVTVDEATRKRLSRVLEDQVGLDWEVMPSNPDAPEAPADPVLARGLSVLRDGAAVGVGPEAAAPEPAPAPAPTGR